MPDSAVTSKSILLVDDDIIFISTLAELIAVEDHKTEVTSNPHEALELIEKNNYDLVITDLGMPEMSGFELAKRINEKHQKLPVVLISGCASQIDPEELKSSTILSLLPKPAPIRMVLDLLNSLFK